ncbi:glycerophosphodiester phosphodiesterase family protein [Ilumatobacter coccineus]|uniref:GP-PDE domain-containing protein n=1 Tax=Ilumatobacter coccineus (strain NBRC 103263 / KCTC 29153 / YM16-304) TaxID=1313172 RepID=A0A6C7E2M6_ILUCY|nr:glycerophosphodiester phosphodiesterase family protein [Ilumatobacter coccineus]BAN01051.1 hypothetical protein YM304_07370 [Ilumatobacter coccineus YM16-304]
MTVDDAHPFFECAEPLMLVSHAGDTASGASSGSMTAYRRAAELGFRAFQVDVVAAPDDTLLSMHAVFGRKRGFLSGTLADTRELAGADVPTLSELFAEFPEARWNIELKSVQCEDALVALIERYPHRERLCVSAPFHTRVLRRLRRRFPDLATNASLLEGALIGFDLVFWRRRAAQGVQLFAPIARGWVIRRNVQRGVAVHVWTVNDAAAARAFRAAGATGLVVDDYAAVAPALRESP